MDTLPFPYTLSIVQWSEHWENFSRYCGNVDKNHPLESNAHPPKINCWWKMQCCPAAFVSRQHLWQLLQTKMALPFLWKTDRTTLTLLVEYLLVLLLSVDFHGPVHTVVSTDSAINFKSGFIRPGSEIKKRFSFVKLVQKPLTKFYPSICTIPVDCMEQSFYIRFSLLV
jgi:hypothetical protein